MSSFYILQNHFCFSFIPIRFSWVSRFLDREMRACYISFPQKEVLWCQSDVFSHLLIICFEFYPICVDRVSKYICSFKICYLELFWRKQVYYNLNICITWLESRTTLVQSQQSHIKRNVNITLSILKNTENHSCWLIKKAILGH